MGDSDLLALIEHNATSHFRSDSGCPLEWEPSGYDFLSPCLQVMSCGDHNHAEFNQNESQFSPISCPYPDATKIFDVEYIFQEADLMGRVITDTEGREAFELWLHSFLPQLFDENFVLEPGELCAKLPLDRRLPHHKS